MKYIKPVAITIFIITAIIFLVNWVQYKNSIDSNGAVFHMEEKLLKVPVKAENSDYLKGVKAIDKKDGDLTGQVIIESISKFVDKDKHICNITYAVEDSEKNITKATRQIQYVDYHKPKFYLKKPLCLGTGEDEKAIDIIGATDVFDGDISNKVKILSASFSTLSSGDSTVLAQATNSRGDTVKMKAHVIIKEENTKAPKIVLKNNLVYLHKGDKFREMNQVAYVESPAGKKFSTRGVKVSSSNVNMDKAGCYNVIYTMNENRTNESITNLTVIVED